MRSSDPNARYTVAASAIRGLLAFSKAIRIDTSGVLEAAGITEASLDGAEARVTHGANNIIWEELSTRSGDPDFGLHFAENMDIGAFDVVGHLLARCRTFGEGLERTVAYSRILHDSGRIEMEKRDGAIAIYPGCRGLPFPCPRQIAEFAAASVMVLSRLVTGETIVPIRVKFQHARPPSIREHTRLLRVEPTFGEVETEVLLDERTLALKVRDPEPGVLTYLDAYAKDVLAKLPTDDDLLDHVERVVASQLDRGIPDMDQVATQLGMSPRTLQRRLAARETTFQALVDGIRRSYAERYLSDDKLALTEIAFLTGFSDPSNFHRAFRRWTGVTPSAFRERAARAG